MKTFVICFQTKTNGKSDRFLI